MRLVFLGSPDEAALSLRALHEAGHEIPLVVSQPDRRRSRGGGADPTPVKRAALELGLPVATPERAGAVTDDVAASGATLGVVVAFGQLIPERLLGALPGGFFNIHFSLLPRWRGAAPLQRAILAGDAETGVCLMGLEAGLDTGPVYACERTAIGAWDTAGDLRGRLSGLGRDLLLRHIDDLPNMVPAPQEGDATYASKLTVAEFALDWHRPARDLERLVRAGSPRPGAFTGTTRGRLKVLRARAEPAGEQPMPGFHRGGRVGTGDGDLVLLEVQPEGRRVMPGEAWARGCPDGALG